MNFNLYKTNDINKLIKLSNKKSKLFLKKDDVDLFHVNKLNKDQTHVVFYISDEYRFGTKKSGDRINVPFDQYVNLFIFSNSPFLLIESINEKYSDLIIKYIEAKTHCEINKSILNNTEILNIKNKLNGFIKEFEYSGPDESFIENNLSNEKFNSIMETNITVDFLLLNVEEKLLSITANNKISVNNSDEDYLIKFTGEVINAIS